MLQHRLTQYLRDGAVQGINGLCGDLCWRSVGTVALPTGGIITADAPTPWENPPLARRVDPGLYELHLATVTFTNRETYTAFAMLRFSNRPLEGVVALEPALFESERGLASAADHARASFGVDSGVACFCDAAGAQALARVSDEEQLRWWDRTVVPTLHPKRQPARDAAIVSVEPGGPPCYAAFTAGRGDGTYSSAWCLGERGRPLALVTDFMVLP